MARNKTERKYLPIETRRELFKLKRVNTLRTRLGLTQRDFWNPLGITQSGGSRYENDVRGVPEAVWSLLRLQWVEGVDIFLLKRTDVTPICRISFEGGRHV